MITDTRNGVVRDFVTTMARDAVRYVAVSREISDDSRNKLVQILSCAWPPIRSAADQILSDISDDNAEYLKKRFERNIGCLSTRVIARTSRTSWTLRQTRSTCWRGIVRLTGLARGPALRSVRPFTD